MVLLAAGIELPVAAQMSGPVLGYVLDRAIGSVRPITGVPGSALAAPPLGLPSRLRAMAVSPTQDFAVALSADRRRVLMIDLRTAIVKQLLGEDALPDRIAISRNGKAVALDYARAGDVRVLTGLPDAIAAIDIDVSLLAGPPDVLVAADDGTLLMSTASAESSRLYRLSPGATPVLLASGGKIAAAAFLGTSGDVVFADQATNTVARVKPTGTVSVLASVADAIASPSAIAATADGSRVFVANSGARSVAILDANGGLLDAVDCPCSPVALEPLSGNATFRLTDLAASPIWVLDGEGLRPRVVFVPVPPVLSDATAVRDFR